MKKAFFLLMISLISFTSCIKEEVVKENTIYRDYHHYYNAIETVFITVYERDWSLERTDNEEYYYSEFIVDKITSSVIDNGNVSAFLEVLHDNGAITQYPLPDVKTWDYGGKIYTETISFELISPNVIAFKVERSDLVSAAPKAMDFKVVITLPRS